MNSREMSTDRIYKLENTEGPDSTRQHRHYNISLLIKDEKHVFLLPETIQKVLWIHDTF